MKPSKGCQSCRARKVKCDEGKPSCQRCLKAGADCVYRDIFDIVHRDQTSTAARNAQRRWRERASISHSQGSRASSPKSTASQEPNCQYSAFFSPIRRMDIYPSLSQMAWLRFYFDFVTPTDFHTPHGAALGILPQLYAASSENSVLYASVNAAAHANFAGRFRSQESRAIASQHYGRALRLLATAATSSEEMQTNDTLLSAYLLGVYEMLSTSTLDGSWNAHVKGSESLLRLRGNMTTGTSNGRFISLIYTHVLIQHISNYTRPPANLVRFRQFFDPDAKDTLEKVVYQVTDVTASMKELLESLAGDSAPNIQLTANALVRRAREVDDICIGWTRSLSHEWLYDAVPIDRSVRRPLWAQELLDVPGGPQRLHTYTLPLAQSFWNFYRGARLHLLIATLDFVSLIPSAVEPDFQATLVPELLALVDDIAESIPTPLLISANGDADAKSEDDIFGMRGYMLVWPMWSAVKALKRPAVAAVDAGGRFPWFLAVLEFCHHKLSIAKAGAYVSLFSIPIDPFENLPDPRLIPTQ